MASETDQILRSHNPDAEPKQIDPKWRALYDQLLAQKDQLIDSNRDLQSKARENQPDSHDEEHRPRPRLHQRRHDSTGRPGPLA